MNKLNLTMALLSTFPAHADNSYKKSPEYKKIDTQIRTDLQECLKNNNNSVKHCIKMSKKSMKIQKKQLKKNIESHKNY